MTDNISHPPKHGNTVVFEDHDSDDDLHLSENQKYLRILLNSIFNGNKYNMRHDNYSGIDFLQNLDRFGPILKEKSENHIQRVTKSDAKVA